MTDVIEICGGEIVRVLGGTGYMSECTAMVRKHRQHAASLGLTIKVKPNPNPSRIARADHQGEA